MKLNIICEASKDVIELALKIYRKYKVNMVQAAKAAVLKHLSIDDAKYFKWDDMSEHQQNLAKEILNAVRTPKKKPKSNIISKDIINKDDTDKQLSLF